MKIGVKILAGFTAVTALTVGLGLYNLAKQNEVQTRTAAMADHDIQTARLIRQIASAHHHMLAVREEAVARAAMRKAGLRAEDPSDSEGQYRRVKDQSGKLLSALESAAAEYQKGAKSSDRAAQWGRMRQTALETRQALDEVVAEVESRFQFLNRGDWNQIIARTPVLERLRAVLESKTDSLGQQVERQIDLGQRLQMEIFKQARFSTLAALALAVLLGAGAGWVIYRAIVGPLSGFVQVIERVGQGDLTQQAPAGGKDELGDMGRSLNRMIVALRDVAGQTREVTENLNAATAEILASTQQQAASAGEQAAAVQQTNATIVEMNQSGTQITERARQVAAAAESTSAAAGSGLQAVENTTHTMESIREQAEMLAENVVALSEKTQAVGEIIASVNDIAEQSHLLALNAAIEAAAAGEHGRSFSVVAVEIKNLADQSKQATVQVRSILGEIQKGINSSVMLTEEAVKRVESGKQQADVAGRAIRQLIESVQQSIQAFQQIAAGANQQQIGLDQMAQAVRNISVASSQNNAGTRQLEKAAADLNGMAQHLRRTVERYQV